MKTCECQASTRTTRSSATPCGRRFPAMDVAQVAPTTTTADVVPVEDRSLETRILGSSAASSWSILVARPRAHHRTATRAYRHLDEQRSSRCSFRSTCVRRRWVTPARRRRTCPRTSKSTLAKQYSTQFAVYTDNEGRHRGLGADGVELHRCDWRGRFEFGAGLAAGQNRITSATLSAGSTAEEIDAARRVRASVVASHWRVRCSRQPRTTTAAVQQTPVPRRSRRRGRDEASTSHVVDFTDPPGVRGDAVPSGGENPATERDDLLRRQGQ